MKREPLKLCVILIITLITSIIFKDKYIYLAPSLNVSISSFIYALTFLIPVLIITEERFRDGKNIINITTKGLLIFFILITILCTISGNLDSEATSNSLRYILTPNNILIGNTIVHYPDLHILGIILIYFLSHHILISVYTALSVYTNKYLSFSLAIFIAFIIDTMFIVPIIHFNGLYYGALNTLDIVKHLTANFMVVIITSLIMIIIFIIYTKRLEKKKN